MKVSALLLFSGSMARAPQVRTGASQVPPLTFHLSYDRGLHLSFQGVVTQGELRVNAPPLPCEKKRNKWGKCRDPVPQKFPYQFKTNNNTLCLAWMSVAAKGRRYVLFLREWKSSFIFCWRAHTVWGQPVSLAYTVQACLGGRLTLPSAFTKARNHSHTHTRSAWDW